MIYCTFALELLVYYFRLVLWYDNKSTAILLEVKEEFRSIILFTYYRFRHAFFSFLNRQNDLRHYFVKNDIILYQNYRSGVMVGVSVEG